MGVCVIGWDGVAISCEGGYPTLATNSHALHQLHDTYKFIETT